MLALATWVAARRGGRPADLRAFFLGGRRLPWPAVAASIVATEISAVTYVSLPSVVYREGGDLTYLQLGLIGSLLARAGVAWKLVPVYFREELYSPYDLVGARLGEAARRTATALFTLGGVLGQASRVYLTAVVLEVVLHGELAALEALLGIDPLLAAIAVIGAVAIAWTWMGGIATVVWTDAVLFLAFAAGLAGSLAVLSGELSGGLTGALSDAAAAGKLRLIDASPDPARAYTLWAALIAAPWAGLGSYGTDQLMTQRLLCCRDVRAARLAIVSSYAAMGITLGVALIGVGLWSYYAQHPLAGADAARVLEQPERVFPVFVVSVVPHGLRGLLLAGAFAAAISSLDSILAALAQTTLALRRTPPADAAAALRASRWLVLGWGALLCGVAAALEPVARSFSSLLDLALAMASYTGGALLAGVALALRRTPPDASGYVWSGPLSALAVLAAGSPGPGMRALVLGLCAAAALAWTARTLPRVGSAAALRPGVALLTGLVGIAALTWLPFELAWPWWIPLGSLVAWAGGLALQAPSR